VQQNPYRIAQSNLQQSFTVNLWSGIPDNCLVGAHVIRGLLTDRFIVLCRKLTPAVCRECAFCNKREGVDTA